MDEIFLKKICENPGDKMARLVYADYLEEKGDYNCLFFRRKFNLDTIVVCGNGDDYSYRNGCDYRNGYGSGYGNGNGYGYGSGYGSDKGYGYGNGNGNGNDNGNGYGSGYGYGYGYGYGSNGCNYTKNTKLEILMNGPYILYCDKYFAHVGNLEPHPTDFTKVIVKDSAVISNWGTTKGIAQLAVEGIQEATELWYEGTMELSRDFIQKAYPIRPEHWPKFREKILEAAP